MKKERKKAVAVNASPRIGWNTDTLVEEAAKGATSMGAKVEKYDLYQLEKFTGCMSCFGCKLPEHRGKCVYRDGLAPVLESIRHACALIVGTPNYLGEVSAGFRALYERLIFQWLTYRADQPNCNDRRIPVLFIMTSNASLDNYEANGYHQMASKYQNTLNCFVGNTQVLLCCDTLQVSDYGKHDWTMFDPDAKKERHETVFPQEKVKAFEMGAALIKSL